MKIPLKIITALLCALAFQNGSAADAQLRGMVTDAVSGKTLPQAPVTLTPDGGGAVLEVTSDLFGRYEFSEIPPGAYTLEAGYRGYLPFSETRTYAADEMAEEDIALTPVVPGFSGIDISIQTLDTSAMLPLSDVPVRVRRYSLADDSVLEETITGRSDSKGQFHLFNMEKGHYDFRFNSASDGIKRTYYKTLSVATKHKLEKHHSATAQLLSEPQTVTVKVRGFDPARPDDGEVEIADAYIELVGVDPAFTLPAGFDPETQDMLDFVIPLVPKVTGRSGEKDAPPARVLGEFAFTSLAPLQYVCTVRKPGYIPEQSLISPAADGALPATHTQVIVLNPMTKVEIVLSAPLTIPAPLDGLEVKLDGLPGTLTEGIERTETATLIPPDPGLPFGGGIVTFSDILPGRYRASVDAAGSTPPARSLDLGPGEGVPITIQFQKSETFDVAQGTVTSRLFELEIQPARIRGRFFKADKRAELDIGAGDDVPPPFDRWFGPAYNPAEQAGIEFAQSALVPLLPPGMDAVVVDTAEDGTFTLEIMPGFYGILIPPLDGYWGSNYSVTNKSTGETFAHGWPYSVDPAVSTIPSAPFGSLGIPVSSGDDLDLDLFVRKQTYFLNGLVVADIDSPALDRVVVRPATGDPLVVSHSHLAAGGTVTFDENDAAAPGPVTTSLQPGITIEADGTKTENASGTFHIEAPPGIHKISLSHPDYVILPSDFEIVPLPDYGFVGEGGVGGDVIPMENNWEQLSGVIDPFISDYKGDHHIEIRFYGHDGALNEELRHTFAQPHYVHHPGQGDRLFRIGQGEPMTMTEGTWTIWRLDGGVWYEAIFTIPAGAAPGTVIVDFYLITEWPFPFYGPLGDPPTPDYELNLAAVNANDPLKRIGDFSVTFTDSVTQTIPAASPFLFKDTSYSGSFLPASIAMTGSATKWNSLSGSLSSPSYDVDIDISGPKPKVHVNLLMKRGSRVSGIVSASATNGSGTAKMPLPDATVELRDRFGRLIKREKTGADGAFVTSPPLDKTQTLFVEINVPGFKRYRSRFASDSGTASGADDRLDFDLGEIVLTPLDEPELVDLEAIFDRRGMFLVGVRKGDSVGSGNVTEDPEVNMGFSLTAHSAMISETLASYDASDGSETAPAVYAMTDPVKFFWIVDPRSFPVPSAGTDLVPPMPLIESGPDAGKPNPLFQAEFREWLAMFGKPGPAERAFYLRKSDVSQMEISPGVFEAKTAGSIDLASLPIGLFQPLIIAETQRGAYGVIKWSGGIFDPPLKLSQELFGMQLPTYLSRFADMIGTMHRTTGGLSLGIKDTLPDGMISLDGSISGDISLNADKTLHYNYSAGVDFKEGFDTPGGGFLTFASGFAGANLSGKAVLDIDGSATGDNAEKSGEPEISFSGAFNGSLAFDRKRYFPTVAGKNPKGGNFVKPLVQVGITPRISVGFEAKESVRVPGSTELLPPLERVGIAKGKAAIGFPITYDIGTQIAYSFPAIAGPIGLLQGTGLNLSITSEPTAGASFTRKWTTRYERDMPVPAPAPVISGSVPPEYGKPAGTFDPKRLAPRRGLLGEDFVATDEDPKTQLGILLGITGKLNATYENKYVGAGAVFTVGTVADSKTACGSFPTLEVTANRNGDSPAYTRVKGGIKAGGEVFGRVWRAKIGKSFTWLSIPIDRPLNTEALFHLAPYDMTESIVSTLTAPPAVWIGTEPHLVSDFHSLGGYSTAASGGAQMLLFTDPDSTGGVVKLKAVLQSSPPAWGSPVEIASAADILDMVVHPLSGGGWMAVWSELGAGSLTEIAPASTLMFSTSATGASWSAPAVIASVSETVFDLHLVPMPGGELGLVYFSTDRGPGASIVDIGARLYSGASWGGVQSLFDDVYLTGWDVAGPGFSGAAPAQIVGFTDVGGLVAAGWDGAALIPAVSLDGSALGPHCSVISGPDDFFFCAYGANDGAIDVLTKSGASGWVPVPAPLVDSASPTSLDVAAVSAGVSDHYFVSWTAGDIGFAYADATGALLSGPEFIRTDGEGDNGSIQAQPVAGSLGARVLAVYEHGAPSQLRTFETTEAGGYVPTDNDADSLDDLKELRIVDADPADLITTILEVHAGDDFDGDGFSNGAELTAMTDPVDPDSFPGEIVQIVAGNAAASELGSTGTIYVLRSGDLGGALTVHYSIAGTAVNGSDYETILSSIELGDGEDFAEIAIAPLADTDAEGDETVELTLLPDAAYALGAETSAVVTITDRPSDQWRFEQFTPAQLSDAMVSGYGADSEFDSLSVLLEYAFDSDPLNSDTSDLPVVGLLEDSGTGETHLAMVYLRRKNDQELVYQVQLTNDLETWTDATSDDVEDVTIVDNGDGTETVTVRKKDPVTTETRDFMRLRVQRVD